MSAAFAPKLELPTSQTVQVTVTEATPDQIAAPEIDLLPHSITLQSDTHSGTQGQDPIFGTHIREAVSIFRDWLGK